MAPAADTTLPFVLRRDTGLYDAAFEGHVVERQPDGTVSAVAREDDGRYVVHFPSIATFAFATGSDVVEVEPAPGVGPDLVERVFQGSVVPFVLQTRGYETLHASAVEGVNGVVGFCGLSGAGKTTIAAALSRRGRFRAWADDALVFRRSATGFATTRLPFEQNLRGEARTFLQAPASPAVAPSSRLHALVVLERVSEPGRPFLEQLSIVEALTSVLTHAYCFFLVPNRRRVSVETYTHLVAEVPVYRLRYESGLDRLQAALDDLNVRFSSAAGRA